MTLRLHNKTNMTLTIRTRSGVKFLEGKKFLDLASDQLENGSLEELKGMIKVTVKSPDS